MASAVTAGRVAPRARASTRALVPQWLARLLALAALGSVGALEWQRLIGGLGSSRALLWVAVTVAAGGGVLLAGRLPAARVRAVALVVIVAAALLAGYALSGLSLDLLKPRRWDELANGIGGGLQALGTVRLPYKSADPWPRIVLELMGAELLILAGLLTFWPRAAVAPSPRVPLAVPDRGYPFVALAVLIVVVASPVVSLGGARPLVLGLTLAALSVCFLWLERLPFRPGLGVAALLGIAVAGALPLAAVADRGEPWFDYRSFAESLGPDDPVRFSWTQSYGPITWPRDGNEVLRITSGEPLYWKARNLDAFNRLAWTTRSEPVEDADGEPPYALDMPEDWENNPAWTDTIAVSVRRMRISDVIGSGTTLVIRDASRNVEPAISPGTWDAVGSLRRGDSYTAEVHVPRPAPTVLEQATSGANERQDGMRVITVPFKPGEVAPTAGGASIIAGVNTDPPTEADVHFKAWDGGGKDRADYPTVHRSEFDVEAVMERSVYERTWALAKRLKRGAEHPMDYIRAVDAYLHRSEFRYTERPPQPPAGQAPLDYFLNVSHEGYCQHFAGAMALLLRMGGISARVATGFSPGGYSTRHKAWIVRDTDAHAWVEAWFDEYGWVTLDPTPDATPARSQVAALAAPPSSAPVTPDRGGAVQGAEPSETNDVSVRPDLLLGTNDDPNTTAGEAPSRWWLWTLVVLLALAAVLSIVLFIRRPRGETPVDRAIAELEDAMRRVGRPVTTGTTLTQIESRFGSYSPEVSAYLHALASGRYAAVPVTPPKAGRRALRRALAQGLGFGARTRALWALPPRFERAPRERRSRTFELDTSVRA